MTELGGKRLWCDGNAGAALPPEADIQRLDTNPELLADFGRRRNGGFQAAPPTYPTLARKRRRGQMRRAGQPGGWRGKGYEGRRVSGRHACFG